MCDVVGAATVYKIVKIDYIALQCKSLNLKEEVTIKNYAVNGTESITESAHTKWSLAEGKRRPIKPMESRTVGSMSIRNC